MEAFTNLLLAPVFAIYETQQAIDQRIIADLELQASEHCSFQIGETSIEVPRLLLTGVRSMSITSARFSLDLQPTASRLLPKSSSLSINLQTEPIANLGEMLVEATRPTSVAV
jgi:hypothetical protein